MGFTVRMRWGIVALSVAVGAVVPLSRGHAQQAPWFGVRAPGAGGDPHRPVVDLSGISPPAATVPAGENKSAELEGTRVLRDVAAIVDFSRRSRTAGDQLWGRVTGFPAQKATAEWSARQFREAGLSGVEVQEYSAPADTPMWWATKWSVVLSADPAFGAGSRDVTLHSSVPTSGSMIDGDALVGGLVDVGVTTDAALPDVEVRGKVAVQHLRPQQGAFSERTGTVARAQELGKRGAIAVLNVVEQTGNMHVRDFGNCGVPCFNIGTADGQFLADVMQRASKAGAAEKLRIRLQLEAQRLTGLKGYNAVGVVAGKSDENLIVNAHTDGWYDAAGDNADGLAVLAALARHFAKPANRPERTLVFVASGGHHSTGLNGPAHFVRMNATLTAKTVMVLNLEHVAQLRFNAGPWTVSPTEQTLTFGVDNSAPVLLETAKRAMTRYGFNLNPDFGTRVSGDLGGYLPLGVARVQAIHSGPMYHTSGDVLETISVPGLERAARFYSYFVAEVARAPRVAINPPGSQSAVTR